MINILQMEMDLLTNLENFDKMCRICLELSEPLTSISLYNIINMIKACASVEIWLNDELPNQICKICLTRLQDLYNFKQLCEKSDNDLRQAINESKNIKHENFVEHNDQIFSKNKKSKNRTKQKLSRRESSVENCVEQTFSKCENSTEDCENSTEDCDDSKCENSIEYYVEETFSITNEVLHSDEQILEENVDKNKKTEDILKSNVISSECDEDEPKKSFVCEECDGRFEKAWYLGFHMKRVHKVEGTKCSFCSLICYHPTHLEIHEQLHRDSIFKCEVCNKIFRDKHKLGRHMYSHSTERPFHCSQCDLSFKTNWVLKKHVQTVHLGTRKYTACHICGKSVNTYHLQDHLSIHGERQTFTCELCDKKFFHEQSLKIHVQRIHEKSARKCRRLCNICGLGTISVAELRAHMRTHTGEKPYNCDKCDKKYSTKSHLKMHISRTHLDERKYVCSVCSRGFYDNNILTNHMRTHTGERPFQCQICEKAFGFKSALYTHMKMHTK